MQRVGVFAVLVAAIVAILALAGVFSGGDDDEQPMPATTTVPVDEADAPGPPAGDRAAQPRVTTVRVGGRPTAVSANRGGVWVADSFSRRAALLRSETEGAKPISFDLEGAAIDVVAWGSDAWYALPERQAVERRDAGDPARAGEVVELDGFPSAVAADEDRVYALSENSVEVVDPKSGEVIDSHDVGGFASGLAVDDGTLWAVVDNREVVRIDAESGDKLSVPVDVQEPFGVAAADGVAWVVGASGDVNRIEIEPGGSTEASAIRVTVKGALDIAVGEGTLWVTTSRRTVARLDASTLKPVGDRIRVGDEAASVSVGDDAVWVANGGDGTLTRIDP